MHRVLFFIAAHLASSVRIARKRTKANATGATSSGCVDLLVIGDFGKMGDKQEAVADGMARVAEEVNPDAILGLGDNIYESGAWTQSQIVSEWKDIYLSRASLKRPWYLVTGNHDWYVNARTMRDFTNNSDNGGYWNMPDFWYSKRWGDVEVFFIDSEIWRGWVPSYWFDIGKQRDWLRNSLRDSDAAWKIVAGHHPVWSVGSHGGSGTMKREMDPIMRDYGANIHLSGHDHSQQLIQHENVHYIVSGAGSKLPRDRSDDLPSPGALKDYEGDLGFARLEFCNTASATLKFYSAAGSVLYSATLANDNPTASAAAIAPMSSEMARDEARCQGVEMKSIDLRCSQDGCTVQTDHDNTRQSCGQYCSAQGLTCVGAWFNEYEDCGLDQISSCDALGGGNVSQVCRCAEQ